MPTANSASATSPIPTPSCVTNDRGEPLAAASITLSGTPLSAITDAQGRFRVPRLPPRRYEVRVESVGYATVTDSLRVEHASTAEIAVQLGTAAVALEPITVTSRSFELERVGFYQRRNSGGGVYVTRAQMRDMPWRMPSDVLRSIAGIQVRAGAPYGNRVVGRLNCPFNYVLNGRPIAFGFEIDELDLDAIEALEVYRGPSEVPAEFAPLSRAGRGNCGVIAIWMRTS
jgi:hypothetical protein